MDNLEDERKKLKEILDSLDNIKMYLKEDGLYALRVLYHYVDELKKDEWLNTNIKNK